MTPRRLLVAGLGLALLAPVVAPGGAAAAPAAIPVVDRATGYLIDSQQADGGFELAGFPGFETSDAILALAQAGQGGLAWDHDQALADIEALTASSTKNPLDAIDDLVDGEAAPASAAAAARAAKVITLVTNPLGLDAATFDPSDDSVEPVDLEARMDQVRQADGSYQFGAQFNAVLYAAIALVGRGVAPTEAHVDQIVNAQRADGSWNFLGDADPETGGDVDTTATALLALSNAGLDVGNSTVDAGIAFLAANQSATGAFTSFGSDDPNATAVASVVLSDLHVDVTDPAWAAPFTTPVTPAGSAYRSPFAWLATQQVAGGRFQSPSDGFGVNTLPTSQSVQALAPQWYLDDERISLSLAQSELLGSPIDEPSDAAAVIASDGLGPNPSTRAGRERAARSVLASGEGRGAAATDLFVRALDRAIDPSGLAYWSNKLITISRPEMLARLTASGEFYRAAGSTTEGFVDAVYQATLGRAGDPSGRQFWIGRINRGVSRDKVARSLAASTEYRRGEANAAYLRLLDRPIDPSGSVYWTKKLGTTRIEVLLASLAGTKEFYDGVTGSAEAL